MSQTVVAAVSVAGAFILMLSGLAVAKSLRAASIPPAVNVTITRINGHKVTTEVGKVTKWSFSGGHMIVEYEPDPLFSANFDESP